MENPAPVVYARKSQPAILKQEPIIEQPPLISEVTTTAAASIEIGIAPLDNASLPAEVCTPLVPLQSTIQTEVFANLQPQQAHPTPPEISQPKLQPSTNEPVDNELKTDSRILNAALTGKT